MLSVCTWCINSFFGVIFHLSTRAFRASCLRVAPCTTSLLAPWFFCVNNLFFYECVCACAFILCVHSPTQSCKHIWSVSMSACARVVREVRLKEKHTLRGLLPKIIKKMMKIPKMNTTRTQSPGQVREATHVAKRRSWQNGFDEQAKFFRPNVSHLLCFWCLLSFTLSLPSHSSSLFMMYNARICCSVILCNVQVRVGSECTEARAKRG